MAFYNDEEQRRSPSILGDLEPPQEQLGRREEGLPMASFGAVRTEREGGLEAREARRFDSRIGTALSRLSIPVMFVFFLAQPQMRSGGMLLFVLVFMAVLCHYAFAVQKSVAVVGDELVVGHLWSQERIPLEHVFAADCVMDFLLFRVPTAHRHNVMGRIHLSEPLKSGRDTIVFIPRGWLSCEATMQDLQNTISSAHSRKVMDAVHRSVR